MPAPTDYPPPHARDPHFNRRVLSFILAGGEGRRLYPLTMHRAKPAVPYGARYRIIDIALSNFINSGLYKVVLLTQYKSDSLQRHVRRVWNLSSIVGHYVECVPAQMRVGTDWYKGSAHAVWQNLYLLDDERPEFVIIFGGDHIYQMDIRQMLRYHIDKQAEVTVAAISYPRAESSGFGICQVDDQWRMTAFVEKPKDPPPIPGRPDQSLVSMGNYIFSADILREVLEADAKDETSAHDFGRDIIPKMVERGQAAVYDFNTNIIPDNPRESDTNYWRDVGTIDVYFETSMELVSVSPRFNLYNERWPMVADYRNLPAAKFVFADEDLGRVGQALDSMVAEGCILSGGTVNRSILFPHVRVNSYADVEDCVLFEGVDVGRHVRLRKCIIEKRVKIRPGSVIGFDPEEDARRFHVSPEGVVVIPPDTIVEPDRVYADPNRIPQMR